MRLNSVFIIQSWFDTVKITFRCLSFLCVHPPWVGMLSNKYLNNAMYHIQLFVTSLDKPAIESFWSNNYSLAHKVTCIHVWSLRSSEGICPFTTTYYCTPLQFTLKIKDKKITVSIDTIYLISFSSTNDEFIKTSLSEGYKPEIHDVMVKCMKAKVSCALGVTNRKILNSCKQWMNLKQLLDLGSNSVSCWPPIAQCSETWQYFHIM